MLKRFFAVLFAFTSLAYGELHDFQKNTVSYEWESAPDFYQCKKNFSNAFSKSYDKISLEILKQPSRSAMVQYLEEAFDISYANFKKTGSSLRWLTAKENGKAIGFLMIDLGKFPEEIYLAQMAVDPLDQEKGIATAMTECLLDQLPETKRLVAITRIVNEGAKTFYRSRGFAPSTYVHDGYSPEVFTGFEYENPRIAHTSTK